MKPSTESLERFNTFNIVFAILTMISGTIGNVIVIIILSTRRKSSNDSFHGNIGRPRSKFEKFLLLLAVLDCVTSATVPMFFAYALSVHWRWDFEQIGCTLIPPMLQMNVIISQSILALIAYERYRIVKYPVLGPVQNSFIAIWLVITLVASVALVYPFARTLLLVEISVDDAIISFCVPYPTTEQEAGLIVYATLCVVKDLICICLFLAIMARVSALMRHEAKGLNRMDSLGSSVSRMTINVRVRNTLLVSCLVFSAFIIPLDMFNMILTFRRKYLDNETEEDAEYGFQIESLLRTLQAANGTMNVFIYSKMHREFRHEINRWFKKLARRGSDLLNDTTFDDNVMEMETMASGYRNSVGSVTRVSRFGSYL